MLEALLFTYYNQFGEEFPLDKCAGLPEIDVINLVYECLESNQPYAGNTTVKENRFPYAPGLKYNG
ncbi:MAG: hypothetical protein Q4B03_01865 [Lachnospiraceae bacterium]|nr:hypothetical protein [Lachnospiraceae bacterium]